MEKKKFKVIHFSYDSVKNPWIRGGGAIRNHQLYKNFPKNVDIEVVCGGFYNARAEAPSGNFKIRYIGNFKNYFVSRFFYSMYLLLQSFKIFRDKNLIIIEGDPFCIFFPFFKRKKTILQIQNKFGNFLIKKYGPLGIIPWLYEKSYPFLYKYTISINPNLIKRHKWNIVRVIPQWVEWPKKIKHQEKNYILYLGRIDIYQKGLDILLKAFKNILKDFPKLRLIIAGSGKDLPKLKRLIKILNLKDSVKLSGWVSGKAKEKLIQNCTLFCYPSRYEGFGISILEAMAFGKPVVSLRNPGLKKLFNKSTGIFIKDITQKNLVKAIRKLLLKKSLRKKLGDSARNVVKNYVFDKIKDEQYKFYRVICTCK